MPDLAVVSTDSVCAIHIEIKAYVKSRGLGDLRISDGSAAKRTS